MDKHTYIPHAVTFQVNRCGITQQRSQCCYIMVITLATEETQLRGQLARNSKTRTHPTFALVGGLVQDGLGGHDLAIPFGHKITKNNDNGCFFFNTPLLLPLNYCLKYIFTLSYLKSATKLVHEQSGWRVQITGKYFSQSVNVRAELSGRADQEVVLKWSPLGQQRWIWGCSCLLANGDLLDSRVVVAQ